MNETTDYIDSYFNGELSAVEKSVFENRCVSDQTFAAEVASYVAARGTVEAQAQQKLKQDFHELYLSRKNSGGGMLARIKPYLLVAAAACLIIFIGGYFYTRSSPAEQLASEYIGNNLNYLSPAMSGEQDSINLAKKAFNEKKYKDAEQILSTLLKNDAGNSEARELEGIVFLSTNQFDEAVESFEKLAADKSLQANTGPFYLSIALFKRGNSGDVERGKEYLRRVVRENLPGRKEAEKWKSTLK